MDNSIKAIETVYKGYRFRSRLEARWAVFFDALGIKWEYEKEGYQLEDGTYYLPDFWLTELDYFLEVKGQSPSNDEFRKCHLLADGLQKNVFLCDGLGFHDGYAFFGSPDKELSTDSDNCLLNILWLNEICMFDMPPDTGKWIFQNCDRELVKPVIEYIKLQWKQNEEDFTEYLPPKFRELYVDAIVSYRNKNIEKFDRSQFNFFYQYGIACRYEGNRSDLGEWGINCSPVVPSVLWEYLNNRKYDYAVDKARQARFEHEEFNNHE